MVRGPLQVELRTCSRGRPTLCSKAMNSARRTSRHRRRFAALAFALCVAAAPLFVGTDVPAHAAASPTVNLDQCANQATPCDWVNGDLNGNNSRYGEGLVVPFRLAIDGLTPGVAHTIHLNYDFTAGG